MARTHDAPSSRVHMCTLDAHANLESKFYTTTFNRINLKTELREVSCHSPCMQNIKNIWYSVVSIIKSKLPKESEAPCSSWGKARRLVPKWNIKSNSLSAHEGYAPARAGPSIFTSTLAHALTTVLKVTRSARTPAVRIPPNTSRAAWCCLYSTVMGATIYGTHISAFAVTVSHGKGKHQQVMPPAMTKYLFLDSMPCVVDLVCGFQGGPHTMLELITLSSTWLNWLFLPSGQD